MKKLLLLSLLFANSAYALEAAQILGLGMRASQLALQIRESDLIEPDPITVVATGNGETCEKALVAAKLNALEKISGSWLSSYKKSKNGNYDERIVEYSGGVIKDYKVLENNCTNVVIEAQVLKRSNRVELEALHLSKQQVAHIKSIKANHDRKAKAISELDNRREAIYFIPSGTEVSIIGNKAVIEITGDFKYHDKWKADYRDLKNMFGDFNLPGFASNSAVLVRGYDSDENLVFGQVIKGSFKFDSDKWNLFSVKNYGLNSVTKINVDKTDTRTIISTVPLADLDKIAFFKVEIVRTWD